ncbi:SAM-dependent methyltransferase [Parasphingorhabdus pacifica]
MDPQQQIPGGVDVTRPSAARVYDYYLGGACNFASDRELAKRVTEAVPWVNDLARENRDFLRRAVKVCVDNGIRQFIDVGSGTPTVGNVHEVAQQLDPRCRVAYADNEKVAVEHSRMLLEDNDRALVVEADLRDPDAILGSPEVRELIDFDEPVALLMVAVLHFVPDSDEPGAVIERYRELLAPGSHFVLSHVTDDVHPDRIRQLVDLYRGSTNPVTTREYAEVERFFAGFELLQPGVTWTAAWRTEAREHPEDCAVYAGVGRKR